MSEPGGVSRQDLLAQAHEMGLKSGGRFIDEWIRQGLLAPPFAPGRGRGVGGRAKGRWSAEQFEVFKEVVDGRVHRLPVPYLCNIPVFAWLVRSEELVPLKQVRRAMATWARAGRRSTWRAAKEIARSVVAELHHPKARPADRDRLEEIIALSAVRGHLDAEVLLAAQQVFDPKREGRWRGPSGMELTAQDYVRWVQQQLHIRALLARPDRAQPIPDDAFRSARLVLGAGLVHYARQASAHASAPDKSWHFPPVVEGEVARSACLAVSMLLEHALHAAELPVFRQLAEEGESLLGAFETDADFEQGRPTPEK